jgi:hypothetical protein
MFRYPGGAIIFCMIQPEKRKKRDKNRYYLGTNVTSSPGSA